MQGLQDGLMLMVGKLPLEVISAVPVLEDIRAGRLQPLVHTTAPSLLAHLAEVG
jgi:hypothetical protein